MSTDPGADLRKITEGAIGNAVGVGTLEISEKLGALLRQLFWKIPDPGPESGGAHHFYLADPSTRTHLKP